MQITALESEPEDRAGATLIFGVMEGLVPLPGSEAPYRREVPERLEATGFKGKVNEILVVPGREESAVVLVGLGDETSFDTLRSASGSAIRKVRTGRAISWLATADVEASTRAVVEGSLLGAYRFEKYKTSTEDETPVCEHLHLVGADPGAINYAQELARATLLARDWVNTPAIDQSPAAYAEAIEGAAAEAGVSSEVWDRERIEAESLGALLGVAAGSRRDPRVVHLSHLPREGLVDLVLVGKGITFDSGGLDLKSRVQMENMKDDMAGSAAVVAATIAMAKLSIDLNVVCIALLTDNAVGGDATRPGDVLRPVEGPTIEVTNTDAEGRLILADGLGLARRLDPGAIVDVATLTGASRVALGDKMGAVFASEPDLAAQVLRAASRAGEDFWELPLFAAYRKMLDSGIADLRNSTGVPYGGAIAAALFLAEYAGDSRWAHLDIAGPSRARETTGELVKGGSGFAVRTLVELAQLMAGAV